jgi:hypothetical protein
VLRLRVDEACLELHTTSTPGSVSKRLVPRSEVPSIADPHLGPDSERRSHKSAKRIGEREMPRVANRFGARKRSDPQVEPGDRGAPGQRRECQPGRLSALDAARL